MILTKEEKEFLDVLLNEASDTPFGGPAHDALNGMGVRYLEIPHICWAYYQDLPPPKPWPWGHRSEISPPLPWPDRETTLRREEELRTLCDRYLEAKVTTGSNRSTEEIRESDERRAQ
jgi:hypothetical protein